MEKYSSYRDAGTGIQPFLTPVPPAGGEILARVTSPVRYLLAVVRTALAIALALIYFVLVRGLCMVFVPIPALHKVVSNILTNVLGRALLFILNLVWIPVEYTTRKRGKSLKDTRVWHPKAGDIIVSNWVSWIEVVWLAIRFNPTFVLPIVEPVEAVPNSTPQASPISYRPGRRTGTGSANVAQARTVSKRRPIVGFRTASLWQMVRLSGHTPDTYPAAKARSLEDIRKGSSTPLVVFPECTTSNGRGLLRFANVFNQAVPVKGYDVFVMCVRYDPPTAMAPTLSHSIPSSFLNPLPHAFSLALSLFPLNISIRLLSLSDSPSSPLFVASEIVAGDQGEDQLSESCAVLISQIGKFKRTGMGWEDKASLLEMHFGRK